MADPHRAKGVVGDPATMLRVLAFRMLVGLVSKSAGGKEFFGDSLALATNMYCKSLVAQVLPSFWLEVPLLGEPGFDLHVYYDRGQVRFGERFGEGDGFGMQALFDWFFGRETGGVGVGFAHDLRVASRTPGVGARAEVVATGAYVNFNRHPLNDMPGFFESLGVGDKFLWTEGLLGRLPDIWRPWYLGVFPGRLGAGVRVGAFVERQRQYAYARSVRAFERDLARAGFTAFDGEVLGRLQVLAALPYRLELQLDAVGNEVGPTLGVDIVLGPKTANVGSKDFAAVADVAGACQLLEGWGAADRRWRHIGRTCLTRVLPLPWGDGSKSLLMSCRPSFIKAKWTDGMLQPAKVYLQCETSIVV